MNVQRLGETIWKDFTCTNPSTGFAQNADSIPTCAVFENNNDSPILTPTVVSRSLTGQYRVQLALTTGNAFKIANSYNVVISATVNGIAGKAVIDSFVLDTPKRPTGQVVADAGNSTTQFKSDRAEAINDYWKDALCLFVTGSLAGQVKKVTAYNGTTFIMTFLNGYTGTPSENDYYELINI